MVPVVEASLLVATAAWGESPANRKAGREIRPPPPPMESTSPARKFKGQMIKRDRGFMGAPFAVFVKAEYIKKRKRSQGKTGLV